MMSRYDILLRDVEVMAAAVKVAAALSDLQQKLLDATVASGKGDLLTNLAKKPEFRGVHFAKLMAAAQALHKKGLVTFDGKMLLGQSFPPPPMEASVSAAKDAGDSKNDKKRKATITDLVRRASALAESTPEGFPEVTKAVKTVMDLSEFIGRMDTATSRLKAAPNGSEECAAAQEVIDALRVNADTMLSPLKATLETMENLIGVASEMEAQFTSLSEQVKALDEKLKRQKERLASAASAVSHAVKLA